MTLAVETVDLVRTANGTVWHVVALPAAGVTLCAWQIPDQVLREDGLDAHVVQFRGRPVCVRCRRALR